MTVIPEEISMEVILRYGHGTRTATIPGGNHRCEMNVPNDPPGRMSVHPVLHVTIKGIC